MRYGRPASRSQQATGSGGGTSASTRGAAGSSLTRALGALRETHVLGHLVVGRREIAPRERALLPVRLPQRDREARTRQLLAEVERVCRLDDAEFVEDALDVG